MMDRLNLNDVELGMGASDPQPAVASSSKAYLTTAGHLLGDNRAKEMMPLLEQKDVDAQPAPLAPHLDVLLVEAAFLAPYGVDFFDADDVPRQDRTS